MGTDQIGAHRRSLSNTELIGSLFRVFRPRLESFHGFFMHELRHRDLSPRKGLRELPIDERIVKPDPRSVSREIAEINPAQSCPVDSAETHRAGFTRRVDLAV